MVGKKEEKWRITFLPPAFVHLTGIKMLAEHSVAYVFFRVEFVVYVCVSVCLFRLLFP